MRLASDENLLGQFDARIQGFREGAGKWPTEMIISPLQFARLRRNPGVIVRCTAGPEGATLDQLAAILAPPNMEGEFTVRVDPRATSVRLRRGLLFDVDH